MKMISSAYMLGFALVLSFTADSPGGVPATTRFEWSQLQAAGKLKSGEVIPGQSGQPGRLKLEHTANGPRVFPLCELDAPPITTPSYAICGTIRYENVIGVGFLEMWNHFPDGGQYFTRTMDVSGPMGMVTGTSAEREFILPFHTLGKSAAPTRLVLNLVLNGPGEVEISSLELLPVDTPAALSGSGWWSDSTGGLIGGIGGSILGLLGGLIGVLTGLGRGQKFVTLLSAVLASLGLVILVGGIYAVATGQPYGVYYPLLLLGGLMAVGGFVPLFVVPGLFRDRELRRMQALDIS